MVPTSMVSSRASTGDDLANFFGRHRSQWPEGKTVAISTPRGEASGESGRHARWKEHRRLHAIWRESVEALRGYGTGFRGAKPSVQNGHGRGEGLPDGIQRVRWHSRTPGRARHVAELGFGTATMYEPISSCRHPSNEIVTGNGRGKIDNTPCRRLMISVSDQIASTNGWGTIRTITSHVWRGDQLSGFRLETAYHVDLSHDWQGCVAMG